MNAYTDSLAIATLLMAVGATVIVFGFLTALPTLPAPRRVRQLGRRSATDAALATVATVAGVLVVAAARHPHGPVTPAEDWTLLLVGVAVFGWLCVRLRAHGRGYHSHG